MSSHLTALREDAYLGDLLMPRCRGLLAHGLQAANNLCFTICGSLVAATILTNNADKTRHGISVFKMLLAGAPSRDQELWGCSPLPRQGTDRWDEDRTLVPF